MKTKFLHIFTLAVLLFSLLTPNSAARAFGTTWYVRSTADGTPTPANCPGVNCRLRDALAAALAGDVIRFNLASSPSTITLTYAPLLVDKNITIQSVASDGITINGNNAYRIFSIYPGVNASISGLTLTNGWISGSGGAAMYINSGAVVSLNGMVITQSSVVTQGGFEYLYGSAIFNEGSLTISNSQITNNTTPYGGVIYTGLGTTLNMSNVVLSGNQQQDEPNTLPSFSDKSAVITVASSLASPTSVTLNQVTFANNTADAGPGAINSSGGSGATITITDSEFNTNIGTTAPLVVGADSSLTVSQSIFSGNQALSTGSGYSGYGGGIYGTSISNQVVISNSSFLNNVAGRSGGGIYLGPGNTLSLANVTVSGNQAVTGYGGGVYAPGSALTVTNGVINSNSAGHDGGGIYSDDLSISGSTINGNSAANLGGGIFLPSIGGVSNPSITNSTISNNQAQMEGGGIYMETNNNLAIIDTTISGNSAGISGNYDGGGIKSSYGSTLNLQRVTISGNSTTGSGGGIAMQGTGDLTNVTIAGNSATSPSSLGGGLYAGHDINLNQVTIAENSSTYYAGGVFVAGGVSFNVQNSILANNTATSGNPDCFGNIASLGFNLIETVSPSCIVNGSTSSNIIGVDPMLDTLLDNGGSTLTMNLLPGSQAIDAADNTTCATEDQRSYLRPQDGDGDDTNVCDMGALEYTPFPSVLSIMRTNPSPTSAASVDYSVKFSEPVSNVDLSDFDITTMGLTGANIANVTGSGLDYTITVNTGTGNGTIQLELIDDDSILSSFSGLPLGGNGAVNGSASGQTYDIDKTTPTLSSIVRASANPTSASSVDFTVIFSEIVTGVDPSDFALTTTGVSSATVSGVSGSGSSYTVSVNTGSGNGTIKLDAADNDSILDTAVNPLGGAGTDNGKYTSGEVYTINKTSTFVDVPFDGFAWAQIEAIYNAGITGGCSVSPLNYCPNNSVTRAQMAIFLLRGIHGSSYSPSPATGTVFADVPANAFAAAWIEQMVTEGITAGCGAGNYCPDNSVTRAQMAVFLLRAKYGAAYSPPAATGTVFTDIPSNAFAAAWIEQLVSEGITAGCGAGNYCPDNAVTRAQMAVFLQRTFNLPLP